MTSPADSKNPPLAEPGKRPSGANIGGVSASADSGLADWAQRSNERADGPALGHTPPGDGASGAARPRVDGAKPTRGPTGNDDDGDEWRHPPVAPVDERNPLRSLGNAIADTLTGSEPNTPRQPPKR